MYIHKEGYRILALVTATMAVSALAVTLAFPTMPVLRSVVYACAAVITIWAFTFFRVPNKRPVTHIENAVLSAADGEIVAIEETFEDEYFHDKRIQVSVFMSIYNVHVNFFPMDGVVSYVCYHPGKKMFAVNPKSSDLNERNSLAVRDDKGREVLLTQVAGIMARRIVCGVKVGDKATAGEELGMIKFGSRVDFFLPVGSEIKVKIGDSVKCKQTVIAMLK